MKLRFNLDESDDSRSQLPRNSNGAAALELQRVVAVMPAGEQNYDAAASEIVASLSPPSGNQAPVPQHGKTPSGADTFIMAAAESADSHAKEDSQDAKDSDRLLAPDQALAPTGVVLEPEHPPTNKNRSCLRRLCFCFAALGCLSLLAGVGLAVAFNVDFTKTEVPAAVLAKVDQTVPTISTETAKSNQTNSNISNSSSAGVITKETTLQVQTFSPTPPPTPPTPNLSLIQECETW